MAWKPSKVLQKNMRFLCCIISLIMASLQYAGAESAKPLTYKSLIAAFSEKKAYYSIEDNVDLKGNTLELPDGAVIDFRGGRILNGKIRCNGNRLIGFSGICENVSISGNVIGPLDISVFELKRADQGFDIGEVLNRANKVCRSICVPEGTYYIKTPAVLDNIKNYEQLGDLIYNGNSRDIVVLKFNKASSAVINIKGKIAYDINNKTINYTRAKKTNIIGIEFVNINNSSVFINDVAYFNNNIRVSASGAGNSYNKYSINISAFSNEHLRIYQKDDSSKKIGWCNENIFIGGRFSNWSNFDWEHCDSYAILIKGADKKDSYNSVNSLLFLKPCIEGFRGYAIEAYNVVGCHWQDARTEDCGGFIRFHGESIRNEYNSLYGTMAIDYNDCLTYPIKTRNLTPIYSISDRNEKELILDTREAKLFKVIFSNPNAKARVALQYITDTKERTISQSVQKGLNRPRSSSHPDSFYYNDKTAQWKLATDSSECEFAVPDNVTKVRIILSGQFTGATIFSDRVIEVKE